MLDVSGNGGGSPILALMVVAALQPKWEMDQVCSGYDIPVSPLIKQWNDAVSSCTYLFCFVLFGSWRLYRCLFCDVD